VDVLFTGSREPVPLEAGNPEPLRDFLAQGQSDPRFVSLGAGAVTLVNLGNVLARRFADGEASLSFAPSPSPAEEYSGKDSVAIKAWVERFGRGSLHVHRDRVD
jgi:hypothetical protein